MNPTTSTVSVETVVDELSRVRDRDDVIAAVDATEDDETEDDVLKYDYVRQIRTLKKDYADLLNDFEQLQESRDRIQYAYENLQKENEELKSRPYKGRVIHYYKDDVVSMAEEFEKVMEDYRLICNDLTSLDYKYKRLEAEHKKMTDALTILGLRDAEIFN